MKASVYCLSSYAFEDVPQKNKWILCIDLEIPRHVQSYDIDPDDVLHLPVQIYFSTWRRGHELNHGKIKTDRAKLCSPLQSEGFIDV